MDFHNDCSLYEQLKHASLTSVLDWHHKVACPEIRMTEVSKIDRKLHYLPQTQLIYGNIFTDIHCCLNILSVPQLFQ